MTEWTSGPTGVSHWWSGRSVAKAIGAGMLVLGFFSGSGVAQAQSSTPAEPICRPGKNYDIITSAFHQSVAQMNDGSWKVWGERGNFRDPNNASPSIANALSPISLELPESSAGVRPKALLVTMAGSSIDTVQDVVLGNDGHFYAWGDKGTVLPKSKTPSDLGDRVHIEKTSLTLPAGVEAGDVVMMTASYKFLVIVTSKTSANASTRGAAFVLGNGVNSALLGDGSASTNDQWHRVKTSDGNDLTNVIAVRAHVNNSGNGAAIALTEDASGNRAIYTWGNNSRIVETPGTGTISQSFATPMTAPVGAAGKPKMVGVTGSNGSNPNFTNATAFYVLYTTDDPNKFESVGTLWAMGENSGRQLGDFTTVNRNTWAAVKKPTTFNSTTGLWSGPEAVVTDVRMFSVQEHDAGGSSNGSAAMVVQNGDVYTWGSNSGAMLGGRVNTNENSTNYPGFIANSYTSEGDLALNPAIRGYLMALKGSGNIKARYIEMGGHTVAFLPEKKPQYCYVGHKIRGSMGDGNGDTIADKWQFQCEGTAAMTICGSDAIVARNDTYTPIPVPDVPTTFSGTVYDNDEWQGEVALGKLGTKVVGEVVTPATPINWGPVPYLDPATGRVTVPPGANPGNYDITYRIRDKGFPDTIFADATITVTISGIKAVPDSDATSVGTPVTTNVVENDLHPTAEPLDPNSVVPVGQPGHGSVICTAGSCTYTPEAGFKGTDTYTYKVCLAAPKASECDTATVTVAVGEPPAVAAYPDAGVTSVNQAITTLVLANDQAVGGEFDPASVKLKGSAPNNTTVVCTAGACTLTATQPGTYTYAYEVCLKAPNAAVCSEAQVTITVPAGGASTPGIAASPDFEATPKGVPVTTPVLYNDSAVNGSVDPASIWVKSGPAHGKTSVDASSGKVTYTPDSTFVGTDTYQYQVCLSSPNEVVCNTATVTVKVGDPAITAENDTGTVVNGQPAVSSVSTNDTPLGGDLDTGSVKVVDGPSKGTVSCVNGVCTYTPGVGFDGSDEYTYQICLVNPKEACSTAKVVIGESKPDLFTTIDLPATAAPEGKVTALVTFGNQGTEPGAVATNGYEVSGVPAGATLLGCDGATCTQDPLTGKVAITGLPTVLAPGQAHGVHLHWTMPKAAVNGTLTAKITPADAADPPANNTDSQPIAVQVGGNVAEVTTRIAMPASVGEGQTVHGTVTYSNIGGSDATAMLHKVALTGGSGLVVRYQGMACTVAGDGTLSDCNLPTTLPAGESLAVAVSYTAGVAGAVGQVATTVGASNDADTGNNSDQASTKVVAAAGAQPDVTTTVAPPATAVAGRTVSVPVSFSNVGKTTATDVGYSVTLVPGLSAVACADPVVCSYNAGTGALTLTGGLPPTLAPGQSVDVLLTYTAPAAKDAPGGKVGVNSTVNTTGDANTANNTAAAATRIINPGVLEITKTLYEGWNAGASCTNDSIAKRQLLLVEKNPTEHDLTWCFTVKNTGDEYLGEPVWDDSAYPTMTPTRVSGSLPLAPGATAVWYFQARHNRSVRNVVSLEMPVTDSLGNPPADPAPAAVNTDEGEATFGMIYDPPYGVKVGQQEGFDVINWTMVWVNDNVVAANNVRVSDVIRAPMKFVGSLVCVPEGTTTVVPGSCQYDATTQTVSVTAHFGADFGKTVVNAQNRLFISFKVSVPATGGTYENQGDATWTPDGGTDPLTAVTNHVPGLGVGPIDPNNPTVPTVTPPDGVNADDPSLGHLDPGAPDGPVGTPLEMAAQPAVGIPVDNPLALLLLALAVMGVATRQHRRR